MKTACRTIFALLAGLLLAGVANAACYTVLGANGQILSQTSTPPVDMSLPLHQTVPLRYGPGAHMIFGISDADCGPAARPWDAQSGDARRVRAPKADRG